MPTRAQLHRHRSLLTRAWDLHIPAICDRQATIAARAGVRTEIAASWERSAEYIVPDVQEAPLADADETRHAFQASLLSSAVRQLESQLQAAADDGELVVAVTDPNARILWTYSGAVMRRKAEKVNFVPGGRWDEASVGTNALDLALRLDRAATVYSAEHFSSCVHGWVCWAAPVYHPLTGRQLGVLDLSTTWDRSHPIGLPTADALARLMSQQVHATVAANAVQDGTCPRGGLLELRLLGRASVQLDGVGLRLTRRQVEILALLALNPGGLDLGELQARLYGDRSVSLGTLKAEMSQLRAVLPGIASVPARSGRPLRRHRRAAPAPGGRRGGRHRAIRRRAAWRHRIPGTGRIRQLHHGRGARCAAVRSSSGRGAAVPGAGAVRPRPAPRRPRAATYR